MIQLGRYSPTPNLPSDPTWKDEYDDNWNQHFYKGVANGFLNVAQGITGTLEWGVELITGENEYLSQLTNNIRSAALNVSAPDNPVEFVAGVVGQAIPFAGSTMVGGAIGGALAGKIGQYLGAAAVSFAVEGENAYQEAKARGQDETTATIERALIGGINAFIEASQVGQLLRFKDIGKGALKEAVKNIRNKALLKAGGNLLKLTPDILKLSINEAWQELLQEGTATFAPVLLESKEALPLDSQGNIDYVTIGKRLGTAALAGGLASPFLAGFGSILPGRGYDGLNVPKVGMPNEVQLREAIARVEKSDLLEWQKEQELDGLYNALEYVTGEDQTDFRKREVLDDVETAGIEGRRSRFPQKVTDDASLAEVGNSIAEYLGLGDWNLNWSLVDKNILGASLITGPKEASIEIGRVTGRELGGPREAARTTQAGTRQRKPGEAYRFTQAELKRTIVHELGHLAKPPIHTPGQRKMVHHPDYVQWVNSGVGGLFVKKDQERSFADSERTYRRVERKTHKNMAEATHKLQSRIQQKVSEIEKEYRDKSRAKIKKERGKRSESFKQYYDKLVEEGESPFIAGLRASSVLKGRMVIEFAPLLEQGFTEEDLNAFVSMAHNSGLYQGYQFKRVHTALSKIFTEGVLPQPNEIDLLEPLFGKQSAKMLRELAKKQASVSGKVMKEALDLANLPRALLATWDLSAPGRQGILMLFADPKAWFKGAWAGFRAFVNPDYANYYRTLTRTHDMYTLAKQSGIDETEFGGGIRTEEPFTSELAQYFPLVRRSELAYVTSLNAMRFHGFYRIAEKWAGTGKSTSDYEQMASVLNHLTGRGDLKFLQDHAQVLNAMFFSPRLFMARIQTFTDLAKVGGATRMYLASTLIEAFATGSLILMLLHWISKRNKKIDVEVDPRSSDFGKIRLGNTRVDYWGGYSQIFRTLAQLLTRQVKSTQSQEVYDAEMLDIFTRFLQTKLSPAAGFALDVYRGEDFKGDIVSREDIPKEIYNRFTPLFIQDCLDAARFQGLDGLALTAPLALNGIGAMTYPQTETGKATLIKNRIARETYGDKWDNLGPDAQQVLKEYNPIIEQQEVKARASKLGKKASAKFLDEQRKSVRDIRRKLGKDIVDELDGLFVNFSGISRVISTDWYLNNARYNEYKAKFTTQLKRILPRILDREFPDQAKKLIIEDVISRLKENIRDEMVFHARFEDLRRMKETK